MTPGGAVFLLGVLLILGCQVAAIAAWVRLSRMTLDRITDRPRLFVSFLLTFGMAAAIPRTSLGAAIVVAEPELGPRFQRRFRRALLGTIVGVLIAYAGLAL